MMDSDHMNETNVVEPGGRSDGCANNNEFEAAAAMRHRHQVQAAVATHRHGSFGEGDESSRVDNKRKAYGEHWDRTRRRRRETSVRQSKKRKRAC